MSVIYIVDFSVEGNSGKNKATREKASALKNIVGKENFYFFHPSKPSGFVSKIINRFLFDFIVFKNCFFIKGDNIVIQRVFFMPFSRLLFFIKRWKVYSEFHADFVEEIPLLNKSKWQQSILKLISPLYSLNYYLSDGIIYNHPYLKEKFDKKFKKKSIYSYNGANADDFVPNDKNKVRTQLGIPVENHTIFLFLGSVSKWHGVNYLIDIFNHADIVKRHDVFLYIIGARENDYVKQLKLSVSNPNVIFKPEVDNRLANDYINAADYCMLPVNNNRTSPGSPLKLYDYISCGKPIIAQSDMHGYADEVENYQLGYTIDFTQKEKAAKILLHILEDNNKDQYYRNRAIAQSELSWGNRIKAWLSFVQYQK